MLRSVFRSSIFLIFVVVCGWKMVSKFSLGIPIPSSETSIMSIPPFLTFTVILVAPASIELSTNSLITEAGLSITSPAAICLITSSDSLFNFIFVMNTF